MAPDGRSSNDVRWKGFWGLIGDWEENEGEELEEGKEGLLSLDWEFEAWDGLNEEGAGRDVGRERKEGHDGEEDKEEDGEEAELGREAG